MVNNVKFIKIMGPREARPLGFDTKNLPQGWGLTIFDSLPWVAQRGDGNACN